MIKEQLVIGVGSEIPYSAAASSAALIVSQLARRSKMKLKVMVRLGEQGKGGGGGGDGGQVDDNQMRRMGEDERTRLKLFIGFQTHQCSSVRIML